MSAKAVSDVAMLLAGRHDAECCSLEVSAIGAVQRWCERSQSATLRAMQVQVAHGDRGSGAAYASADMSAIGAAFCCAVYGGYFAGLRLEGGDTDGSA